MPVNDPDAGTAPVDRVAVRAGVYADSVTLLQLTQTVGQAPGVQAALVAMATELNLQLLAGMGFAPPPTRSPHELFIAVRARDPDAAAGRHRARRAIAGRAAPARPSGSRPPSSRPAPSARPPTGTAPAWR